MFRFIAFRFIAGAIAGSLAVWLWGKELKRYATSSARVVRERAADTLQSVEHTAAGVLDTAVEQVHATLQAGRTPCVRKRSRFSRAPMLRALLRGGSP